MGRTSALLVAYALLPVSASAQSATERGGRIMRSLVFGVAPSDPVAILGAVVSFMVIALAAILVATGGAARADPMTVSRAE